jgi:hypothetical protein
MKKHFLFYFFFAFCAIQINGQSSNFWKSVPLSQTTKMERVIEHKNTNGEKYYSLDVSQMKQSLSNTASVRSNKGGTIVSIPNFKGQIEQFEVWENSNFDPILQAKYPEIRAYTGKGITDRTANINFSLAPIGFQTAVFRIGKDAEFIEAFDKEASVYVVFNSKNSHAGTTTFKCGVKDTELKLTPTNNTNKSNAGQLKTMRLAASCNGEYAQHFGGTKAGALSGINASLTRMNALFERDLAIHVNLIANNDDLLYLNPATDPFSDGAIGAAGAWNLETQNNLTTLIGNTGYDLGHLFCKTGGGGNAGCLGCVCIDSTGPTDKQKGAAFTAPDSDTAAPAGDVFDYDFLAHEFGHQFGASHTFSYAYEGSGTNVEPGSGCATMGYAGVTNWDVQPHNIIQFATASIQQVQANMATKLCPVNTLTGGAPFANDVAPVTIPKGTAFKLVSTATHPNPADVLSYSWEQNDDANASTEAANSITTDTKLVGPTFRLYNATSTPERYMPKLAYVLNGQLTNPSNWETVSNVARDLNFTFTARDNHPGGGQTDTGSMKVTVVTTSGPFEVTSQNTAGISYLASSSQTITWNANNTAVLPGSSNVDILLSTDAGLTFTTILASAVPNNGTASVTMPNVNAANCRIMIKPTGNIYYAVNSTPFEILNITLGISDVTLNQFGLYPNPNNGNFTVSFDPKSKNEIKINVNDLSGRNIFYKTFKNSGKFDEKIDLGKLQPGVYLVIIQNGENKMVKKIIVQ